MVERKIIDMSFINKKGEKVVPDRDKYYAEKPSRDYAFNYNEAGTLNKKYDSLVSKYGKDSSEVYKFEKSKLGMHRERKPGKLEGFLVILSLVWGIFFLSNNLTGNVISQFNQTSSNLIGASLFLIGIVGAFFYFRRK